MRLGASVLAGVVATALGTGILTALPGTVPGAFAGSPAVGPAPARASASPSGSTSFRVGTFNVLGASHTAKHGDESGRPSGTKRIALTVQAIRAHGLSIVGFQEMERSQYAAFTSLTGGQYGTYPGDDADQLVVANNIAWRTDTWRLLSATTFTAPYFYGKYSRRPLVLLQNVHTGQEVYVMNTHNPANTRGDARAWRNRSVAIEAALITRLRSTHPDIPVLFTGDMNDWSTFYCPMTAGAPVHAAYGGSHVFSPAEQCTAPGFAVPRGQNPHPIDWIMGSPDVAFSGATRLKDAVVAEASDHPLYWSDATVAARPAGTTGLTHVVAIDAEGLSSKALRRAGTSGAPHLTRLRARGAGTLEARTEPDSTSVLPNAIGMLTGRKVLKKGGGGHGVKKSHDDGRTVAKHAGGHVESVYNAVRRAGHSTALYSSDPSASMIRHSWHHAIATSVLTSDDAALTATFRKKAKHLKAFSFVQLTGTARAGRQHGFSGAAYKKAVKHLDHRIGQILHAVAHNPRVAGNTLVVVTASAGGRGHATGGSHGANYRVPFLVWGHGVPGGQDLYAMNPALLPPGSANPGLTVGQPVRNAMVADLATSVLRLPAVRGSILNSGADLQVQHAPAATLPHDPALAAAARAAR